jgi:hypothetical protein
MTMLAVAPVTDGSTAFIIFTVMILAIFVAMLAAIKR